MTQTPHGVMPAIVTPLDDAGVFRPDIFERQIERLYQAGVYGLYLCGAAGEGPMQSLEQRQRIVEVAKACTPDDKQLIVQVGAPRTRDAIALAEHSAKVGIRVVASLPPAGEYTYPEIRLYYEELAAGSPLPLIVYHHRGLCPILTPEMALELCGIPNVIGIKYTDLDLWGLSSIRHRGHIVFNGRDEVLAAGLLMGASGGIGAYYNIFPEAIVAIYEAARQQRWTEAAAIQRALCETFRAVSRFPLVPAIRAVLQFTGIECGESSSPRRQLTRTEHQELRALFDSDAWFRLDRFMAGRANRQEAALTPT